MKENIVKEEKVRVKKTNKTKNSVSFRKIEEVVERERKILRVRFGSERFLITKKEVFSEMT